MRLGHAAASVLSTLCQWLHGAADDYEQNGVPLTVRDVAKMHHLSRSVVHRDGFKLLTARGVIASAPDPDRPTNPKARRYHVRHPSTWTYPAGVAAPDWNGPEPVEVAPFGPVLLWPRGWTAPRRPAFFSPAVGRPGENPGAVSSPGRTPRGRNYLRDPKDRNGSRCKAQQVDSYWTIQGRRHDPLSGGRGRDLRVGLVDAVAAVLSEAFGAFWCELVPTGYRQIPACLVARVAQAIERADTRQGWKPPLSWIRSAILRARTRTEDEDDAAALAYLDARREAEAARRLRLQAADELLARWPALDAEAMRLGAAGADLDELDGRAGDTAGDLLRQVRAAVAAVADGNLAELEIAGLLANDLSEVLTRWSVRVFHQEECREVYDENHGTGEGTDVPTRSDLSRSGPDTEAAEVLAEAKAVVVELLDAIDTPPPPGCPEPRPGNMRARLPWLKLGSWRKNCRIALVAIEWLAAADRMPGARLPDLRAWRAALTRARQRLAERPELPGEKRGHGETTAEAPEPPPGLRLVHNAGGAGV